MPKETNAQTLHAICPIYGLGWTATDLKIRNNVTLRFVDDFEKKEGDEFLAIGLRSTSYRCTLEITGFDPKDYSTDPWLDIQSIALNVEAALRIYHEGKIGVAAIIYYQNDQRQSAQILDSFIPNGQEDYQIDKAKLEQFPTFFADFEMAYEKKPVVLQYFSRAQQRFSKNDKSIDLCTALESLFVPTDSRGAKKIFLTQGVNILGFSANEVQMISDLYDYRNTIIHGDHKQRAAIYTKKRSNYTTSWFEDCENLIRRIVQKYISRPWQ